MTDDDIIQLIENFAFDAGPVVAQRRNRGFTLVHAKTGVPIARLRPLGRDDLYEILYWSLRTNDGRRSGPLDAPRYLPNRPCASSHKRQSFGPASEIGARKWAKSS